MVVTEEMEREEKQLMQEGQRKEEEMIKKVILLLTSYNFPTFFSPRTVFIRRCDNFLTKKNIVLTSRPGSHWREILVKCDIRGCNIYFRRVTSTLNSC